MSFSWYEASIKEIASALLNENIKKNLQKVTEEFVKRKKALLKKLPYVEECRRRAIYAKTWAIEHSDETLKLLKDSIEDLGGFFYYARTKSDVYKLLEEIVGEGKIVVKSKSMTSEELNINSYIEKIGSTVYETDLGELILQLGGEKGSHIVVPAVHLSRKEVAEIFSKVSGEKLPADTKQLTLFARKFLREKFIKADIGISGANIIAAESGTIFILENEGNARNATNLPEKHIVIAGLEKIVYSLQDAFSIISILPPYATGQQMTCYVSMITGPSRTADIELTTVLGVHGPLELHVIIVDNGRTRILKDPLFKKALLCIRCGTCLNHCPVYRVLGGVFGYRYFGGIGAVWTYFTESPEKAAPIAYMCSLCRLCEIECPMEIPIAELVECLREKLKSKGYFVPELERISEKALKEKSIF